jgi:hypothetical protein
VTVSCLSVMFHRLRLVRSLQKTTITECGGYVGAQWRLPASVSSNYSMLGPRLQEQTRLHAAIAHGCGRCMQE